MSAEDIFHTTHLTIAGEWWWLASRVNMLLGEDDGDRAAAGAPHITWDIEGNTGGAQFIGRDAAGRRVLYCSITGTGDTSFITAAELVPIAHFWRSILQDITLLAKTARDIRRLTIGYQFDELLDEFYQARTRGENPKLVDMARAHGLNYDSLRQHKVIYDRKRKNEN